MTRRLLAGTLLFTFVALSACKGKKTETDQSNTPTAEAPAETPEKAEPASAGSSPKTYTITATPDSAILGTSQEAIVKVNGWKAIELSDPDGKVTGTQVSFELEVTNKQGIGKSNVMVNPNNFRLELDNGTKIPPDEYQTVTASPEATASSGGNIFKLPPGRKPVALNLFYDETRAVLKLNTE